MEMARACFKNTNCATVAIPQGLKPLLFMFFSARLKSCPDTKRFLKHTLHFDLLGDRARRIPVMARQRKTALPLVRPAEQNLVDRNVAPPKGGGRAGHVQEPDAVGGLGTCWRSIASLRRNPSTQCRRVRS